MLQAHSKLGPAKALALSVCLESLATVSIDVMGAGIVKFFQSKKKYFSISSQKIAPSLESESEILNPNQLQCCTEGNHMI